MLPLPPLDGGRVAIAILPPALGQSLARLERVGFAIILGVLFVLPLIGEQVGKEFDVFNWLVFQPAQHLMKMIMWVAGI